MIEVNLKANVTPVTLEPGRATTSKAYSVPRVPLAAAAYSK